ncbi:cell pole-organizing protein PopZ [Amorphus orientalis]|uniref:Cell pole-organizing protein PopZ n=2 Tax=Amorphus orientalis TaxID=649198 RepID=A0AAE3VRN4_9HYPH|nr:cell pole-organizing protein PopZ [Amorphus orientalis]
MAQAKHDPSMDELLASIRRIISQDEDEVSEAVPLAATGTDGAAAPGASAPAATARATPEPEPEPEDDLAGLDLDMLPDLIEQSIREAFPEAPRASAWDAAAMEAFSAALEEEDPEPTVSLWDADYEAGGFPDDDRFDDAYGFSGEAERYETDGQDNAPDTGGGYVDPPEMFAAAAFGAPVARRADLDADREEIRRLMSDRSSSSVGSAFDELARSMHAQSAPRATPAAAAPASARTMEDVVQDCLRPMLQAWLDENLPDLVERMVQQEIDRVARKPR